MANVKISELTAAGALTGTELVEIVQDGANVQTTVQDIVDLAPSGVVMSNQTTDFTADGTGHTVYTNNGAAGFITATLPDSAAGTQITFIANQGEGFNIGIYTAAGLSAYGKNQSGTPITINDSTLGYTNGSVTFLKISATEWQQIGGTLIDLD